MTSRTAGDGTPEKATQKRASRIAAINLPPGSYRFRYWADGQWFCDYAAFGVEPGPFGLDSVVRIPLAHAS